MGHEFLIYVCTYVVTHSDTIIDALCNVFLCKVFTYIAIKIDFSLKVYYAVESRGYVVIEIFSSGGASTSTNPITLTIIPVEQLPVSAIGIRTYII